MPNFDLYAKALNEKALKTEDNEHMSSHLDIFVKHIKTEYATTLGKINNLTSNEEITFDLLWAILVPRTILYTTCRFTGEQQAVRLKHAERDTLRNGVRAWVIHVEYVEYNEEFHAEEAIRKTPKFGFTTSASLSIPIFAGAAKITSLPHYPIKYCPQADDLMGKLVARGRKWCALQGAHHLRYFKGTCVNRHLEKVYVCP